MTWSDIVVFESVRCLSDPTDPLFQKYMKAAIPAEERVALVEKHPRLVSFVAAIGQNEGIKEGMGKRPSNEEEPF